jgi:hypothetical protein
MFFARITFELLLVSLAAPYILGLESSVIQRFLSLYHKCPLHRGSRSDKQFKEKNCCEFIANSYF